MTNTVPTPTEKLVDKNSKCASTWYDYFRQLSIVVPIQLASYTVTTVPAATSAGQIIYVSNESGGAVIAFSDGTNWRRVTDRAIIS